MHPLFTSLRQLRGALLLTRAWGGGGEGRPLCTAAIIDPDELRVPDCHGLPLQPWNSRCKNKSSHFGHGRSDTFPPDEAHTSRLCLQVRRDDAGNPGELRPANYQALGTQLDIRVHVCVHSHARARAHASVHVSGSQLACVLCARSLAVCLYACVVSMRTRHVM